MPFQVMNPKIEAAWGVTERFHQRGSPALIHASMSCDLYTFHTTTLSPAGLVEELAIEWEPDLRQQHARIRVGAGGGVDEDVAARDHFGRVPVCE
jgi:hypothetical protein